MTLITLPSCAKLPSDLAGLINYQLFNKDTFILLFIIWTYCFCIVEYLELLRYIADMSACNLILSYAKPLILGILVSSTHNPVPSLITLFIKWYPLASELIHIHETTNNRSLYSELTNLWHQHAILKYWFSLLTISILVSRRNLS